MTFWGYLSIVICLAIILFKSEVSGQHKKVKGDNIILNSIEFSTIGGFSGNELDVPHHSQNNSVSEENEMTVKETYQTILDIAKKKHIQALIILLLLHKIGFMATDSVSGLVSIYVIV